VNNLRQTLISVLNILNKKRAVFYVNFLNSKGKKYFYAVFFSNFCCKTCSAAFMITVYYVKKNCNRSN